MKELLIENLKKSLRDGQKMMGEWQGGELAISAVPGAGKSHCLSIGAALAIANYNLHAKKQLLIVTYTRSAAVSIKTKINRILKEELQGILGPQAQSGFMVQTLHGLALNIASRYRDLLPIDLENATVIIPTPSHKIIRNTVENWINKNEFIYQKLLKGKEKYDEETEKLRRQMVLRTDVLPNLAYTVIKEAKSSGLSPEKVDKLGTKIKDESNINILNIASELYHEYEILLKANNYIDYEDMILAALKVLENQEILRGYQEEIFAVFEDEAQDSSPLQGKLSYLLASNSANNNSPVNLVRVGDPNQAINSTFTPADPDYFNYFCDQCEGKKSLSTMDQAGRSNIIIIKAANCLVEWLKPQNMKFREQLIKPVSDHDPQVNANPEAVGKGLEIHFPDDIYEEIKLIGNRVKELLKNNNNCSAAILVKENSQGSFLAQELADLLKEEGIKIYEVGEIERQTKIPEEMLNLLKFIDRPHSSDNLKSALEVLESHQLVRVNDLNSWVIYPENFLYPLAKKSSEKNEIEARLYCTKLLKARLELSPNDLIPFLGMTLGYEGGELATMQKLSERINQQIVGHNSLKNIINILEEIVILKRFDVVEEDDEQNKYIKPNQLTIITMHKSKGLDWDYVFIPFLTEDILPKSLFVNKKENFLGNFRLNEVARTVIRNYIHSQDLPGISISNISSCAEAWKEAEQLKIREEYRLLYVAMTRAKQLLYITSAKKIPFNWTTFYADQNNSLEEKEPCPFLPVLQKEFAQ